MRDSPESGNIGIVQVHILHPMRPQGKPDKAGRTMNGNAAGRYPLGASKANEASSVGGIGKKRKSTAAPPSKNEAARSLQSARNRTNLARAGTSVAVAHPSQQKHIKLQATSSPLRGVDKRDIARTPTAGSFTPGLKLMTT